MFKKKEKIKSAENVYNEIQAYITTNADGKEYQLPVVITFINDDPEPLSFRFGLITRL